MSIRRYLALDIGAKRIGVAVGTKIPQGLGKINVTTDEAVLQTIADYVDQEVPSDIVVGYPQVLSGDETESARLAKYWAEKLGEYFHLPVRLVDESLTSVAAEAELKELGFSNEEVKHKVDERAAIIILEQFINEQGSDND